jgi:hypothetical protein
MTAEQILREGHHCYLSVPKGQMIEGYLAIAPYRCFDGRRHRGCLAHLNNEELQEVKQLRDMVGHFYRECYGIDHATFYEQGRAGGGAVIDTTGRFPHHAHLCGLPLKIDLHSWLKERFEQQLVNSLLELPTIANRRPYVYIEGVDRKGKCVRAVYLSVDKGRMQELETLRLKPVIADLLGKPDRWNWRIYPGDTAARRVRRKFADFVKHCGQVRL